MLFLILLEEYVRWTGDRELARELEREARAAIAGSTSTAIATVTATSNTSAATPRPASRTSAGRTPGIRSSSPTARWHPPRATCELQGYVYDAKRRTARLARDVWGDPAWADRSTERPRS